MDNRRQNDAHIFRMRLVNIRMHCTTVEDSAIEDFLGSSCKDLVGANYCS